MQKVNIMIGRFQPFTAGHYKCVEAAKNKKNLKTVICMINVTEDKVDKKHPFPSDMLIKLYSKFFNNDANIADVVLVKNADIVSIGKLLNSLGYQPASWTCGTDRYDSYSKMAERYHDQAMLSDDFEVIEIARSDEDISATKARNCLLDDDFDGFKALMPNGVTDLDQLFSTLKDQIEKVKATPEVTKKRSKKKLAERLNILDSHVKRLEMLIRNSSQA